MNRLIKTIFVLTSFFLIAYSKGYTMVCYDTTLQTIQLDDMCCFMYPSWDDICLGDTIFLYPKKIISDGSLIDFPAYQLFSIKILEGAKHAKIILTNGTTTVDTSHIPAPIRILITSGGVRVAWETCLLYRDTSDDARIRKGGIKAMLQNLTAPRKSLRATMLQTSGYLKMRMHDYDGARECFQYSILEDSTKSFLYQYDIACTYAREGNSSLALQWLQHAFNSGYHSFIHALYEDSDLVSLRGIPKFRQIITSPLVAKRTSLLKSIKENSSQAGTTYFEIANTYLQQADIDSFFIAFEESLKNDYYPRMSMLFIDDEYSSIRNDPRLKPMLTQYADKNPSRISTEFDATFKPEYVRRVECNQDVNGFLKCPYLVELRITHSARGELSPNIANMKMLHILRYIGCGFRTFQQAITQCILLDTLTADKGLSKSLPDDFGDLVNLKQLNLRHGRLESLPSSFSKLKDLNDLSLRCNALSLFPEVLFSLNKLEVLDISGNSIADIPNRISTLDSLKLLNIADNKIITLTSSIGMLKQLKRLDVSLNCLSFLPEDIANLPQLEYLDVSFNDIKHLPEKLKYMTSLQFLNVYGNLLSKSEIDTLRYFLPHCRIVGEQQNEFQVQQTIKGKKYTNKNYGISFFYPPQFSLTTKKEGPDSSDFTIEVTEKNIDDRDIDTITYHFSTESILKIKFSRNEFDQIANDVGFSRNSTLGESGDIDTLEGDLSALWISTGRQGMKEDVSVISYKGWRGFWGTNATGTFGESDDGPSSGYQGLHEFYVALARKKYVNGLSISVSYFNDISGNDTIFQSVLSSIILKY